VEENFAFLGTLNKDGSPQVTPTWIDIIEKGQEEMILVNTAMDRVKQKNVSRAAGIYIFCKPASLYVTKSKDKMLWLPIKKR
jgi:hypothetical protein